MKNGTGRPTREQLEEKKRASNSFDKLYDEACENLREDRKMTKKFLETYRNNMSGSADLLVAGSSIAKFIEVMTDMNRHMIDLAKVKQSEYESSLYDAENDDEKDIYDTLQKPIDKTPEDKEQISEIIKGDAWIGF